MFFSFFISNGWRLKQVTHPILRILVELFPFNICTVVTVMGKQCWSQAVLESGSWGHSVLQTPALVLPCVVHNSQISGYILRLHGRNLRWAEKVSVSWKGIWVYTGGPNFRE